ncbi:MAG: DUF1028 domain-containing protein [Gaiellaceae bacterium]
MTYSLVGRDAESGEIGVAVESQAFNCGAAVPWARPGVGAVATQSSTDRRYGWRGLELLAAGSSPADTLARLRAEDELADLRQVGIMGADGQSAQWTGAGCVPDAGHAHGDGWIAQANMVASPRVWSAMGEAFDATDASLAERLLAGLEAADREGGDWRGRGGAAVIVVPADGEPWERVVDLRVEEGDESLAELRRLLERALSYRAANRATADRAGIGRRGGLPETHVRRLAIEDALDRDDLRTARSLFADLLSEQPRWLDFIRATARWPEGRKFLPLLADNIDDL